MKQSNNKAKAKQGTSATASCCGAEGMKDMFDSRTKKAEIGDCCSMMGTGMKACRWFPLFPVMIGIALFLVGYYVNAEITRVMWMVFAGSVTLLGILGLILAGRIKTMCCG